MSIEVDSMLSGRLEFFFLLVGVSWLPLRPVTGGIASPQS